MRFPLLLLILFTLAMPALANNVYVGNKPYEGTVFGTATEVRFVLPELARALELELEETDEGWNLGGRSVPTILEGDKVWVQLEALPSDLIRVVRNSDLNTIDLFVQEAVQSGGGEDSWGRGGTLVFFYADWSEACRAMEQTMAQIALSRSLRCEFLNIDHRDSPVYRKYAKRFEGNKIPFYLLLDNKGRKIESFSGFLTYPELIDKLKEAFSN